VIREVPLVDCAGCGAVVDPSRTLPFGCPNAPSAPSVDHVLTPRPSSVEFPSTDHEHPFLRYRDWTLAGRLARWAGLSDARYEDIVLGYDESLRKIDGRGLTRSPFAEHPKLATATGIPGLRLWVKDETNQPAGSHKIRHLTSVMLYLEVLEVANLPAAELARGRSLAIASCGNAALAASVAARATGRLIDVFIPPDADKDVVRRLRDLDARVHVCERPDGMLGDPCVHAFRAAVAKGSLPVGAQGPENGLAIEGSRLIAYEIAEELARTGETLDAAYLQVGGGAFGSGIVHGFREMEEMGVIPNRPRVMPVQTLGCRPLVTAYEKLTTWATANGADIEATLRHGAEARDDFMSPWPEPPHSIAHGILDDEAYDWLGVLEGVLKTGGVPVVAPENRLVEARDLAQANGVNASHTGASGLGGLLTDRPAGKRALVILSGVER